MNLNFHTELNDDDDDDDEGETASERDIEIDMRETGRERDYDWLYPNIGGSKKYTIYNWAIYLCEDFVQ